MGGRVRATAVVLIAAGITAVPAAAIASPTYDVPFPCGQTWTGSTRPDHSSYWAIDFNRYEDEGDLVVASAPGRVEIAQDYGDTSWGKYVVVDHGRGRDTRHAHLTKILVVVGQRLDVGDPIGLVGDTGYSFGAHLHYEQRQDEVVQYAAFDGVPFDYATAITSTNCPTVPIAGDWNGDRSTDVGAFKRAAVSGQFRERLPTGEVTTVPYGRSSDTPVTGDWDGDGNTDVGTWRQAAHQFFLRQRDGTTTSIKFGQLRDRPITGDWDGDHVTDVGVWRPATATFYLRFPNGAVTTHVLGTTTNLPVTGDWDGDGRFDVGVYDRASSTFILRMSDGTESRRAFGQLGDLPVTGDWNGNGVTNIGVWSPRRATFSLRYSPTVVEYIHFGYPR